MPFPLISLGEQFPGFCELSIPLFEDLITANYVHVVGLMTLIFQDGNRTVTNLSTPGGV
ncbi:hypothetical protein H7849_18895 [Alloacidobacterium dinghuense]|uniref:Uncharacterized protein n=1 Tax=Alloacidobacterium dinghuense TaxID=2763107 RepID=A0A7G8BRP6_9BACT|nr:hypothetical protein [Alloacidobacterium dinghuense]QNI35216.1 hypothetical protein H7849_18895 [Alloacidobacterium dinghuense]